MGRSLAVLFVIALVPTFGAAACGGGLTQEQSEALEKQGEGQELLIQQQQQQQEEIEQLEQDVAQLKQQLQVGAPALQDAEAKKKVGGEQEETLEK